MGEHLAILNNSFTMKEGVKRNYVMKCVDDIKEVTTAHFIVYTASSISRNLFHFSILVYQLCQGLNFRSDVFSLITIYSTFSIVILSYILCNVFIIIIRMYFKRL